MATKPTPKQSMDELDKILGRLIIDVQKRYIYGGKTIEINRTPYLTLRPAEPQPDTQALVEQAISAYTTNKSIEELEDMYNRRVIVGGTGRSVMMVEANEIKQQIQKLKALKHRKDD